MFFLKCYIPWNALFRLGKIYFTDSHNSQVHPILQESALVSRQTALKITI